MSKIFVILWMIFFHIIDDYVLQAPCLSSLKQKSWWEKNAPDELYKHDYIWALIMHSLSWAFMIMLPIAFYHHFNVGWWFVVMLAVNAAGHALVDHVKANWKQITLWHDQLLHISQILFTSVLLFI